MSDSGLSRPEWLQTLVGVAIKRFVESGSTADVSEAVGKLMRGVVIPRLPPHLLEERNDVRRLACYSEAALEALSTRLASLRNVFAFYCKLDKHDTTKESQLLSPKEFVAMCEDVLPGPDEGGGTPPCYLYLSERDLQRIFLTSRMRLIDPIHVSAHAARLRTSCVLRVPFAYTLPVFCLCTIPPLTFTAPTLGSSLALTPQGKRRLRFKGLSFEDFCEAFVRVAILTPVPFY